MLLDPRAILLFGANALLLYLAMLVNSALASWSIYLLILGPMLVFPALYLRHQSYFICTLFTGLWVDAALPSPFGLFTVGFFFAGAFIFLMRIRFRTEHNYHPIVLAHGVNFFCILLVTIAMGSAYMTSLGFWLQVFVTSLASHLALLIVAPWFFNFERMLFTLFRLDPEPEDLPIL
jgi:cell shape-determining protein MreD|tara:strand:- start:25 stop:555 length:531 start_codon:yes stop_codon:yes gene_type:complete